jgi:hypothetical protein
MLMAVIRLGFFLPLWHLVLITPPVWFMVGGFLVIMDAPTGIPAIEFLVCGAFSMFLPAFFTLMGSFAEALRKDGYSGPLLVHVAAAAVLVLAVIRLMF